MLHVIRMQLKIVLPFHGFKAGVKKATAEGVLLTTKIGMAVQGRSETSFFKLLKIQNGLHHCVDLIETIKMHIWNVRFGLRMKEIWLREVLHPGQTGLVRRGRSDRFSL